MQFEILLNKLIDKCKTVLKNVIQKLARTRRLTNISNEAKFKIMNEKKTKSKP